LSAHNALLMGIRVEFEGGPADGTVSEYAYLDTALPSLYWHREEPVRIGAIYRRASDDPDPVTGAWHYTVASN
jgi:hypothetical protein